MESTESVCPEDVTLECHNSTMDDENAAVEEEKQNGTALQRTSIPEVSEELRDIPGRLNPGLFSTFGSLVGMKMK